MSTTTHYIHLQVLHRDEAVLWSETAHGEEHVQAVHRHGFERLVHPNSSVDTSVAESTDTRVRAGQRTGHRGTCQV